MSSKPWCRFLQIPGDGSRSHFWLKSRRSDFQKKTKKQLGIVAGTPVPLKSEPLPIVVPKIAGFKPEVAFNATLDPDNGKPNGRHSYE